MKSHKFFIFIFIILSIFGYMVYDSLNAGQSSVIDVVVYRLAKLRASLSDSLEEKITNAMDESKTIEYGYKDTSKKDFSLITQKDLQRAATKMIDSVIYKLSGKTWEQTQKELLDAPITVD